MRSSCIGLLLSVFVFCACKKESPASSGNGETVYVPSATAMSAKVDGTVFAYNGVASSSSSGITTLYLSNTDVNAALSLIVENNTAAGTYTIGTSAFPNIGYNDNGTYYQGTSGTITVNTNDTVHQDMKGSFSGTVTNFSSGQSHSVTAGSFVLNYQ